jgi:hypothetical protein
MKKGKLKYMVPQMVLRRLLLEEVVAAPMSAGRVSAQVDDWTEETLGDDAGEGGDLCVMW